MIDIKIKISKSICAVVFLAIFFRCETDVLLAYTAAFIHELAHCAACIRLGIKVYGMSVGALGMRLDTAYVFDTIRRIVISVAGPVVSFLLFVISAIAAVLIRSEPLLFRFAFLNLCIAFVNALPVVPLDGGVVLKAVLSHRKGIIRGQNMNRKIALCILGVVSALGVWMMCVGCMSISFGAIVSFLIMSLGREDALGVFERLTVFEGESAPGGKIRYISADCEDKLSNLASCISHGFSVVAAVFDSGRFIGELSQNEIIYCINKYGVMCTAREGLHHKEINILK